MEEEIQVKERISMKKIFSLVAIGLAILAAILFIVLPAIKIDASYAYGEIDTTKGNMSIMDGWSYTVAGFAAIFGIGTYDVYKCDFKTDAYTISLYQEKLAFNYIMLIAIIVALIGAVLYGVMYIKKIKNNILNKVVIVIFILAGLLILLSAVWFYALNPIEESNYYSSVTKLDTDYKYVNAHLSAGPIIASIMLLGSGIFTAIGEY